MSARDQRPPRVLVAEDEPAIADALTELLELEGYEVGLATRAAVAVERACVERWDAILVDTFEGPPHRIGESDRALLRGLSDCGPVIVVSGRSWVMKADAVELGVVAIVPKPYDADVLLAAIRAAGATTSGAP